MKSSTYLAVATLLVAETFTHFSAAAEAFAVFKSNDRGQSWMRSDAGMPGRSRINAFGSAEGVLFAGTDANGVFASDDEGRSWTHLATGLPSHAQVFALSAVKGRLFAGLYSRGLYTWDEPRHTWARTGPIAPLALARVQNTLIAGHNPGGLYWSGDLGASWSKGIAQSHAAGLSVALLSDDSGELSAEAPVWELGSDDGLVLAGAAAGIYHSEDGGRTWTRARRGLPENSPGIAFLLKRDFVLAGMLIQESRSDNAVRGNRR